jgi:hypothetical protein
MPPTKLVLADRDQQAATPSWSTTVSNPCHLDVPSLDPAAPGARARLERNAQASLSIKLGSPHAHVREAGQAELAARGWTEAECRAAARDVGFGSPGEAAARSAGADPADRHGWAEAFRRARPSLGELDRRS